MKHTHNQRSFDSGDASDRSIPLSVEHGRILPMPTRLRITTLLSLTALFVSGCQMYSPYPQHPGMYSPSAYPPQPIPQTVPQSTMVLPGDQLLRPSIQSQPIVEQPTPTFRVDENTQAPTPSSTPNTPRTRVDNKVPEPRDPGPTTNLEQPELRTSEVEGRKVSRVPSNDPVFLKPVVVNQAPLKTDSGIVSASAKGPLGGFEEDGRFTRETQYRWLQGMVEYDQQRKSWHLIYDMSPNETDRLGGEVTLSGQLPFQMTDSNGFFRVYGGFDSSRLDKLAKPVYTISKVERLQRR